MLLRGRFQQPHDDRDREEEGGRWFAQTGHHEGHPCRQAEGRSKVALDPGTEIIYLIPVADDPIKAGRGMLKGMMTWAELMEDYKRDLEIEERDLPPGRQL